MGGSIRIGGSTNLMRLRDEIFSVNFSVHTSLHARCTVNSPNFAFQRPAKLCHLGFGLYYLPSASGSDRLVNLIILVIRLRPGRKHTVNRVTGESIHRNTQAVKGRERM